MSYPHTSAYGYALSCYCAMPHLAGQCPTPLKVTGDRRNHLYTILAGNVPAKKIDAIIDAILMTEVKEPKS